MSWLTSEDGERRRRILSLADTFADLSRDALELSRRTQERDEAAIVWIVALSAGALVSAGPIINSLLDVTSVPRWQLVAVFSLFALAIPSGIAHRFVLKELMAVDSLGTERRRFLLAQLARGLDFDVQPRDDINKLETMILAIYRGEYPQVRGLRKNTEKWQCRANCISYVPPISFVGSLISFAVLYVIHL